METTEEKIAALHGSGKKVCLVCTGAGAGCQNLISQIPGASNTLLECFFPYSKEALGDFLGVEPEKFASEDTALRMAARAWRRATEIVARQGGDVREAVGVAVTGVIATSRPLRGEHRVFIAARTDEGFHFSQVTFLKDDKNLSALGRIREGEICDVLALNMILYCAKIPQIVIPGVSLRSLYLALTGDGVVQSPEEVKQDPKISVIHPDKHVLFEGSFKPLHFGHERIAREVERLTGKQVVYVITNKHPDKGGITEAEIETRTAQFQWLSPVMVTESLKLFVDKAKVFPGFSFLVGVDTLKRILDPKYEVPVEDVLKTFEECQTHFFVANRHGEEGLLRLETILENIPSRYRRMFTQVATVANVSSSALRQKV